MIPKPGELTKPPEDKVVAKLEFIADCAAVYAASIGTSSIKRLMSLGIQPSICDNNQIIHELLDEVSLALAGGGLSWVDRAKARLQEKSPERFAEMEREGWDGAVEATEEKSARLRLITSIEEVE
jgi:nitrogen fixation protein NifX